MELLQNIVKPKVERARRDRRQQDRESLLGRRRHALARRHRQQDVQDAGGGRHQIQMISTSEIKISVVIDEKYMELAVRALHQAFDLDQVPA